MPGGWAAAHRSSGGSRRGAGSRKDHLYALDARPGRRLLARDLILLTAAVPLLGAAGMLLLGPTRIGAMRWPVLLAIAVTLVISITLLSTAVAVTVRALRDEAATLAALEHGRRLLELRDTARELAAAAGLAEPLPRVPALAGRLSRSSHARLDVRSRGADGTFRYAARADGDAACCALGPPARSGVPPSPGADADPLRLEVPVALGDGTAGTLHLARAFDDDPLTPPDEAIALVFAEHAALVMRHAGVGTGDRPRTGAIGSAGGNGGGDAVADADSGTDPAGAGDA